MPISLLMRSIPKTFGALALAVSALLAETTYSQPCDPATIEAILQTELDQLQNKTSPALTAAMVQENKYWQSPFAQRFFKSRDEMKAALADPALHDWVTANLTRGNRYFRLPDEPTPGHFTMKELMDAEIQADVALERAIDHVVNHFDDMSAHHSLAEEVERRVSHFGIKPSKILFIDDGEGDRGFYISFATSQMTRAQAQGGLSWEQIGQRLGVDIAIDTRKIHNRNGLLYVGGFFSFSTETIMLPANILYWQNSGRAPRGILAHESLHAAVHMRGPGRIGSGSPLSHSVMASNIHSSNILFPNFSGPLPEDWQQLIINYGTFQDAVEAQVNWLNSKDLYSDYLFDEIHAFYLDARQKLQRSERWYRNDNDALEFRAQIFHSLASAMRAREFSRNALPQLRALLHEIRTSKVATIERLTFTEALKNPHIAPDRMLTNLKDIFIYIRSQDMGAYLHGYGGRRRAKDLNEAAQYFLEDHVAEMEHQLNTINNSFLPRIRRNLERLGPPPEPK